MTLPTKIKRIKKRNYLQESYLYDFFATKLLSDESHQDYLILLIATLIEKPVEEVAKGFSYLDIRLGLSKDTVDSVADLVVKTGVGIVSIEVNWTLGKALLNKNTLYMFELALRQVNSPEDYKKIEKIYQINLNSKPVYREDEFITRSNIRAEALNLERIHNILEIIDVNLDYLGKKFYTEIKEKEKHSIERLLYIFANANHKDLDEIYEGDELMEAVKEKLYGLECDIDRYLIYDREKLREITIQEEMENDCRLEGEAIGLAKGRKEGRKEERLSIARKMLQKGITLEELKTDYDYSDSEIRILKKDLGI